RFASNRARVDNRPQLVSALEAVLVTRTRDEWLAVLVAAGVPAAPVNSVAEALRDPMVRERMVAEVDGVALARTANAVDGSAMDVRSARPHLGAHTAEIREYVTSRLRRPEQGES